MKKYLAELIGTFSLVFCGTGTIIINELYGGCISHVGIAITFGLIVTAIIYSFGKISGAQINPAVSIALAITGELQKRILPYILFQITGAFLASGLLKVLFPKSINLGATLPSGSQWQSFVLELILTCILMTVIFKVTKNKVTSRFAGIAIKV